MRRTSFARRNTLIPRGARVAGAGVLALILFIVGIRLAAPQTFIALMQPLWHLSNLAAADTEGTLASLDNPGTLEAKLDAALESNTELSNENAALTMQVHDLENLLGSRTAPQDGILASVVARPPMSPYDSLIIDQGDNEGVKASALVTGPGGVPIGTVASVDGNTARVQLYSAPGVSTDAWIGTAHIPVTLTGEGSGAFSATIDKTASTTAGDVVYAAAGGAIPVGTVVRVDSDSSSPTAMLRIQPVVNPYSITWVLVSRS